ncbi:MAG: glycosyltransferase [Planctomycetes bacterium]|nr:glycosyltransferase [Planctomycetota bacterium]
MKILLVAHGFPPENVGGTETYVERLALALHARGHEVVVVAGTLRYEAEEPRVEAFQRDDGLRGYWILRADLYFDSWEKSYEPRVGRAFREILERERPDVVHVHHWVRLTRDLLHQAYLAGIPGVVTLHDLWTTCLICFRVKADQSFCTSVPGNDPCRGCVESKPWHGPSEIARAIELWRDDARNELALARRVFVPSRAQGELVSRVSSLAPERFTVLPHGIAAELPPSPTLPGVPGRDRPLRVACWSHLYPAKGQQVLLEAVRRARHRAQLEVDLLGDCWDPSHRASLAALAEGSVVRFRGPFRPPELAALRADLAVLPSLCHESYSFVVDEARALGWPLLATRAGALEERVPPGGELFTRGDADELARLLDAAIDEPERLARWRAAVRPPDRFADSVAGLEEHYAAVLRAGLSGVVDRFDGAAHEDFETYRSEQRYRHALRWSGAPEHIANLERENRQLRAQLEERLGSEGGPA